MKESYLVFIISTCFVVIAAGLWYLIDGNKPPTQVIAADYKIVNSFNVPNELHEISAIVNIEKGKLACVEDEHGSIYIFNLKTEAIEKTVEFSKSGDFEGLAVVNETAYALKSNGTIFKVQNFRGANPKITEIKTFFTAKNDMESMTFDAGKNRLLLIPKNSDPLGKEFKGVYVFNLKTDSLDETPLFKISKDDPIFSNKTEGDKKKILSFYPSEIAIHPKNQQIYILDGRNSRLLILDTAGKPLKLYHFNKKEFPQPEGMTFSKTGDLYISNEQASQAANILQVELN